MRRAACGAWFSISRGKVVGEGAVSGFFEFFGREGNFGMGAREWGGGPGPGRNKFTNTTTT
jgi:hypothetical protein